MFYKSGPFDFGLNISNIGSKMSYTETAARDFLPTNLRMGFAFKIPFSQNHILRLTYDLNKLLVPTQPVYNQNNANEIVSGYDPNVGVFRGMVQSFYDAPGVVTFNNDGTYTVEEGSVFREELSEITVGGGVEYEIMNSYFIRTGYFHEHYSKGNRKYLSVGTGFRLKVIEFDLFWLYSVTQPNPLANTIGTTLKCNLNWR